MPWNDRKTLALNVPILISGWSYDGSQMVGVRASDKTKSSRFSKGHLPGTLAAKEFADCQIAYNTGS
jgi:hypothetical protein